MSRPKYAPTAMPESEKSATASLSNFSIVETALPDQADKEMMTVSPQVSHGIDGAPLSRKATSVRTTATSDPRFEVEFEEDDQENPRNWPVWYKGLVIFFMSWTTWRCGFSYILAELKLKDRQHCCVFDRIYYRASPDRAGIPYLGTHSDIGRDYLSYWSGCGFFVSSSDFGNLREKAGIYR